ncbi:MAG: chemotaxis protein CheD [Bacteriovorax sp.]|nr:chemotaxis protein CheD [Bacteriovorax sp.]
MTSVHVKIGEIFVGSERDVMTLNLGTDLGLVFVWKKKKLWGVAHCLLPESPTGLQIISGRFVSQAVPSMIEVMNLTQETIHEIEVHVIGAGGDIKNSVARKNIEAAERYLETFGFRITSVDVGGEYSRYVVVDCAGETVHVVKLDQVV